MRISSLLLALACFFFGADRSRAAGSFIVSPDTAQTSTFERMETKYLYWDERDGMLKALITFTNEPYVQKDEWRHDETYRFRLPGVDFDPDGKLFYIEKHGQRYPVAALRDQLLMSSARPVDGTRIYVYNDHGLIHVALGVQTGSRDSFFTVHWVEVQSGWRLQNFLAGSVRAIRGSRKHF